ncbi:RDD family protein [Pontibacter diazotrophicus]|uniref:RDD family protein n=1 Tax=Pontibacter diazotrophicus TaxID=1400979 RepID=A0A3D8LCI2_9BACT|nr:RDD family protein [Pontibacter diazotrophicus]RDV14662.1 RDD family protein [Pontibacter diazotrophicus]
MEFYTQEEDRNPIHLAYAKFSIRLVAFLIDWILLSILSALVLTAIGLPLVPDIHDYEARLKMNFISIVMGWLYYAGFESSSYQATPGKQAMGIFVTDTEGYAISFSRATGRFFGRLLSGLILLFGYIMAAFTERRQALHDILAKTLVLKHPAQQEHV